MPVQTHAAMWLSLKMTHRKWNCPSFLVLEQFVSVFEFICLGPLPSESAFLIKRHAIGLLALQKSEVLRHFGFLERYLFDPAKKATFHNTINI